MPSQQPKRPLRAPAAPGFLSRRNIAIGFVALALVALTAFFIRAGARADDLPATSANPADAAQVALGQRLYVTRCASCHGAALAGEPDWPQRRANGTMPATPLSAAGPTWQRDDGWIFTTIKAGGQATAPPGTTSAMPPFGNLTNGQIWAIIAYIKSTWPEHIRAQQPTSAP